MLYVVFSIRPFSYCECISKFIALGYLAFNSTSSVSFHVQCAPSLMQTKENLSSIDLTNGQTTTGQTCGLSQEGWSKDSSSFLRGVTLGLRKHVVNAKGNALGLASQGLGGLTLWAMSVGWATHSFILVEILKSS